MGVWKFNKDGTISNGSMAISFDDIMKAVLSSNTVTGEVNVSTIGEPLTHNNLVYMDQTTGKIFKAVYNIGAPNQKQNLLGVYRYVNNKHYVVYNGLLANFGTNLVPGAIYNLSNELGKATYNKMYTGVKLGRAVSTTDLLISIDGNIDMIVQSAYDTTITNGVTDSGITLTEETGTMSAKFNKKTFDLSIPAAVLFFRVGDVIGKFDFATEYTGDEFVIEIGTAIYSGVFNENQNAVNPTVLTLVGGGVVEEPVEPEEPVDPVEPEEPATAYNTSVNNNANAAGISMVSDTTAVIVLNFDSRAYDLSTPAEVMFFQADGLKVKLDLASEYKTKLFEFIYNNVTYVGTFAKNESYANATVLTVK